MIEPINMTRDVSKMRKIIFITGDKGLRTLPLGAFYAVEGDRPMDGFVDWLKLNKSNYPTWWDRWSDYARGTLVCTFLRSKGYEELILDALSPNYYHVEESMKPHRVEQKERELLATLKDRYEGSPANTSTVPGRSG